MGVLNIIFGKNRFQFLFERLHRASLKGMNYGRASDYRVNGESTVLAEIRKRLGSATPVLFDVGANKGEFTKQILDVWKNQPLKLFAFEPSQKTFVMLRSAIGESEKVRLINAGLGERPETVELYYDRPGSGLASVYQRDLSQHKIRLDEHETIELTTLDLFCEQQGVEAIDFLKMDVEGHELAVLRGGRRMFDGGKIRFVQFEFGGCNIDSRSFFRDYYDFFKKDFDLYRVLSDGLMPITAYSEKLEVFLSANYLAIKR